MITEDYISWKTAKLMKVKGFDILHFYGDWYHDFDNTEWMKEISEEDKERGAIIINEYSFPLVTLQMAMKWLREVHNIFILIDMVKSEYRWRLRNNTFGDYVQGTGRGISYEETCEAAVGYCLENLI